MNDVVRYRGSCHCGTVRFEVEGEIAELGTCPCSLCRRRQSRVAKVHESKLKILAGGDALTLYQWNTRRARHYFCARCGIHTFNVRRTTPDYYSVNVGCLEDFDASALPVRPNDGIAMTVVDAAARPEWTGPRAKA
ncbi:MAG TPA: GFA family protein [Alphaproteobacteria bacterium]|nr:GFA family protein [Alphaproteobacteria bacterium]